MPKRPNQSNNTKLTCKKLKSCLALHDEVALAIEDVQELLGEVIVALHALVPSVEEQMAAEGEQDTQPAEE